AEDVTSDALRVQSDEWRALRIECAVNQGKRLVGGAIDVEDAHLKFTESSWEGSSRDESRGVQLVCHCSSSRPRELRMLYASQPPGPGKFDWHGSCSPSLSQTTSIHRPPEP